jgi:hypothetical protein
VVYSRVDKPCLISTHLHANILQWCHFIASPLLFKLFLSLTSRLLILTSIRPLTEECDKVARVPVSPVLARHYLFQPGRNITSFYVTDTGGCKFGKIFDTPGCRIASVCYSYQYERRLATTSEGYTILLGRGRHHMTSLVGSPLRE